MREVFILILALNICHYIGDYTHLSKPFMLAAKKFGSPLWPIFLHALVHALLMSMVVFIFVSRVTHTWALPLNIEIKLFWLQLLTHFVIDVAKGRANKAWILFQDPTKYPHWYLFGADQLLHQVVIITMVYILLVK